MTLRAFSLHFKSFTFSLHFRFLHANHNAVKVEKNRNSKRVASDTEDPHRLKEKALSLADEACFNPTTKKMSNTNHAVQDAEQVPEGRSPVSFSLQIIDLSHLNGRDGPCKIHCPITSMKKIRFQQRTQHHLHSNHRSNCDLNHCAFRPIRMTSTSVLR